MDFIFFSKSIYKIILVFVYSSYNVVRNTDI